jgi:hypothetical protein
LSDRIGAAIMSWARWAKKPERGPGPMGWKRRPAIMLAQSTAQPTMTPCW